MNHPNQAQIEAVAEWWAVKTFDVVLNQDNGTSNESNGNMWLLMNYVAITAKERMLPEARQNFKDEIMKALTKAKEEGSGQYEYMLSVDYNPNQKLARICQNANVDPQALPCKSHTQWDANESKFIGRFRYGGDFVEIA